MLSNAMRPSDLILCNYDSLSFAYLVWMMPLYVYILSVGGRFIMEK
jgi:hypothetical protein